MRTGPRGRNEVREEMVQHGIKLPLSLSRALRDEAEARRRGPLDKRKYQSDVVREALLAFEPVAKRIGKHRRALAIAV